MAIAPKTGTLVLHSWRDFTKVMFILSEDSWLYRGQEDADWLLQSSLERELSDRAIPSLYEAERMSIELFRTNAKIFGHNWESAIDTLVAMQHYEAKTRLLDFSTSIMVALFFAFEKVHKIQRDRAIYAVNFKEICKNDHLRTLYAEYRQSLGCKAAREDKIVLGYNKRMLVEDVEFRQFVSAVANKVIAEGSDENGVLPLYTAATNKRQFAQAGVQLMPLTFSSFTENLASALDVDDQLEVVSPSYVIEHISKREMKDVSLPTSFMKLVFDKSMEDHAWNILSQANITPATIYPDIVGLAKSLRYLDKFTIGE